MGLQDSKIIVHDFEKMESRDELRTGTILLQGKYTIEDFLGADGFGITYLATVDDGSQAVIKECFPAAFCCRRGTVVEPRSSGHKEEMASVVSIFVKEARRLSKLRHPNVIAIHNVFEENGTGYVAMDLVKGRDLLDLAPGGGDTVAPELVQNCLEKLLDGLGAVHRAGMLHRDISPDNIIVRADADPVLIDFGTARGQATKASRILSVLRSVKDGYTPQESYISGGEESPSCDLYSLAATFYHLIAGELPAGSQLRVAARASGRPDPYVPLGQQTDRFDETFCVALDRAMAILPSERFQSTGDWLTALRGEPEEPEAIEESDEIIEEIPSQLRRRVPSKLQEMQILAEPETETEDGFLSKFLAKIRPEPKEAVEAVSEPEIEYEQQEEGTDKLRRVISSVLLLLLAAGGFLLIQAKSVSDPELALQSSSPQLAKNPAASLDGVPTFKGEEMVAFGIAPGFPTLATEADQFELSLAAVTPPDGPVIEAAATPQTGKSLDEVTGRLDTKPTFLRSEAANVSSPSAAATPALPPVISAATAPEAAVVPEVVAAPDVAPEVAEALPPLPTRPLTSESRLALPFTASASDPSVIGSVEPGAPVWMRPGLRIASVNGTPILSLAEVGAILSADMQAESTEIQATFGISGRFDSDPVLRNFTAPVVHEVALENGFIAESRFADETWQTRLVSTIAGSGLVEDDVFVGVVGSGDRIDGPATLAGILDAAIAGNRPGIALAVERDGALWVEVLTLPQL